MVFRTLIAILIVGAAQAHDFITTKLTWSREVSRIFYRRCISCHNEQGSAFPLTSYETARPWAEAIKEEVLARRMPPWGAVKGFGEFKHDAGMTQEEIEIVSAWVEGGAPKGDESLLPLLPAASKPAVNSGGASRSVEIKGTLTLKQTTIISGIRPAKLQEGASVRVVAERPDGSLIPLIWIYNYNPKFSQTYYFKTVLTIPKGSTIKMSPPGEGSLALLVTSRPKREL